LTEDDLILDILGRVQRALGIDGADSVLAAVERDVRTIWGGDRVYVGKTKFDRESKAHRNARIRHDYRCGERPLLLARRYKLSVRRIRQIIREDRRS